MSDSVLNTSALQNVLPPFFRDVEIVGSADVEVEKYRKMHLRQARNAQPVSCQITGASAPVLLTNQRIRDIYQSNRFSEIKKLEEKAQKDLQPIYDNISRNGDAAWTKVRSEGKEFYMSWAQNGCMWVNAVNAADTNGTTYQAVVQIGTYSKSSGVLGIHSYNLTFTTVLVESVIAFIVAKALSGIVAKGLAFVVDMFAVYICQAAAKLGLQAFSCTVAASVLSTVATCLVFVVVFIGLTYLWNWLNRKYTIRLQIFNWDTKNSWSADGEAYSNAKIAGSNDELAFTLPPMEEAGSIVTPPGFQPVEVLDSVCYYAAVVWENDNTFMQGCSMALRLKKQGSSEGFMWAFDCPRFADNKQGADDGLKAAKDYLNKVKWKSEPKSFEITSTSANIPVAFALDALSGADDNLYNINIHINSHKK